MAMKIGAIQTTSGTISVFFGGGYQEMLLQFLLDAKYEKDEFHL
jgi:hypothetical protein